jgi:hypothetical protein
MPPRLWKARSAFRAKYFSGRCSSADSAPHKRSGSCLAPKRLAGLFRSSGRSLQLKSSTGRMLRAPAANNEHQEALACFVYKPNVRLYCTR